MKNIHIKFNQELSDVDIIPGKCSECPFFMVRTRTIYGKKDSQYICLLTGDDIDEEVYYHENTKHSNCPIKEVNHD